MNHFLGQQDCVESLRRDLIDLQGAVLEVFSRTGPVRVPSWKFPDRLSCNVDLVSLLDKYDFVDGDNEFNQLSHIVLLELVIDRLLLLLQSFNVYAEQLKSGHKKQHCQKKGCVSVGLVVRQYWRNLVNYGYPMGPSSNVEKVTKAEQVDGDENTTVSSASSIRPPSSRSDLGSQSLSALSSASSFTFIPQNHVSFVSMCSTPKVSCSPSAVSSDSHNVSCQTVESSLVPCDACDQVQSILRQTGDALVDICQSEGLPTSLQRLLVAVDDTMGQGRLTAVDVAHWAKEQKRDMGRLGKHMQEVRGTIQPLKDRLVAADKERKALTSQLERTQQEMKHKEVKHQARMKQLESTLQETQNSMMEREKRLDEEQQQMKKVTCSLEESNSRLEKEVALQYQTIHALESERDNLQNKVKTLQAEQEACRKLEERTQQFESQMCKMQLLLDKETAKNQSACRQQESMQAKQRSLLEKMDALDQECEELQKQLEDSEEKHAELQEQLKYMSQEKEQLQAQFNQQEALCIELQGEKQRLETIVEELKNTADHLRGEVEDLTQRERLMVAFPELNPIPQAQPQSTGNVIEDMEKQLQANSIRIRLLEQENATLHSTLLKLRERAQHDTVPYSVKQEWSHSLPNTNTEGQHRHTSLQSSSEAQWKNAMKRRGAGGGARALESMEPWDRMSSAASSSSAASLPSPQLHQQTLQFSPDTHAAKTNVKVRQASQAYARGSNLRRK